MALPDYSSPFTLYYGTFSLFSTMVRTTFALRGAPRDGRPGMQITKHPVAIGGDNPEQLSEFYLTKVNPKGSVPALANTTLLGPMPMAESRDISLYIAEWYPSLLPEEHRDAILDLLAENGAINFTVLTFGPANKTPDMYLAKAKEILTQPDISDEYRQALEVKAKA